MAKKEEVKEAKKVEVKKKTNANGEPYVNEPLYKKGEGYAIDDGEK
ncbi:MAG: hypothetical protein ABFC84_16715 [Veillonellales bacterium]